MAGATHDMGSPPSSTGLAGEHENRFGEIGKRDRAEPSRRCASLHAQGLSLRAIRDEMRAKGYRISHEGVAGILERMPN